VDGGTYNIKATHIHQELLVVRTVSEGMNQTLSERVGKDEKKKEGGGGGGFTTVEYVISFLLPVSHFTRKRGEGGGG